MDRQAPLNWLMEHAGPVIRYRTAHELVGLAQAHDLEQFSADLLRSPLVKMWLSRLPGRGMHGSHSATIENVLYKLGDLGLHAGVPALDGKVRPLREMLQKAAMPMPFSIFGRTILAAGLARLGYLDDHVRAHILKRLERLHEWAQQRDYDVHLAPQERSDIRPAYRSKPILRPGIVAGGNLCLPWIHDVYALAALRAHRPGPAVDRKVQSILEYSLHPRYQALPEGYGYLRSGARYYAMGWSVHLPGYHGFAAMSARQTASLLQRVELMAHFPTARASEWFRAALDHLKSFRTDIGTYRFPAGYLKEQASGYYVTGAYTRLEADRRRPLALEADSTFRMACILRLAGQSS